MKQESDARRARQNTANPDFSASALGILARDGELLVFSRYLADKRYVYLTSAAAWYEWLGSRKPRECLTLFRQAFQPIRRGRVSDALRRDLRTRIRAVGTVDWVVLGQDEEEGNWCAWVSQEMELEEVLEGEWGKEIIVVEDQDWCDEEITIHAYVPDADGLVRPGAY